MAEETEITTEDIKQPKKLLPKVINNLLVGAGATVQELIASTIRAAVPQMPPAVQASGELLVNSIAAGQVKNKYVKNFMKGMSAGASKDLFVSIKNKIMSLIAGAPAQAQKTGLALKFQTLFGGQPPPAGTISAGTAARPPIDEPEVRWL